MGDVRTPYMRDRARIIHSAAFRRLQGKTQVMGVGEGDFHRTRLTHSIEVAQIAGGILHTLKENKAQNNGLETWDYNQKRWLPNRNLIEAACLAHDLGHPPFGHGGERVLFDRMRQCRGFEGNGQTLRILCKLERYQKEGGINPTRRLVLAVLKYPLPYSLCVVEADQVKPPKCFYDEEQDWVDWALHNLPVTERELFMTPDARGKPQHMTFDCALMELADDIAYAVHDLEDIVARKMVTKDEVEEKLDDFIAGFKQEISIANLFGKSWDRKNTISKMVNLFVSNVRVEEVEGFSHTLFRHRPTLPKKHEVLLNQLKTSVYELVTSKPQVQQLERRGERMVGQVFDELNNHPAELIPDWEHQYADDGSCQVRKVCDYIAGMTDDYLTKVYRRLFVPGYGSSTDEL